LRHGILHAISDGALPFVRNSWKAMTTANARPAPIGSLMPRSMRAPTFPIPDCVRAVQAAQIQPSAGRADVQAVALAIGLREAGSFRQRSG
jgi:hypothetical protein